MVRQEKRAAGVFDKTEEGTVGCDKMQKHFATPYFYVFFEYRKISKVAC